MIEGPLCPSDNRARKTNFMDLDFSIYSCRKQILVQHDKSIKVSKLALW